MRYALAQAPLSQRAGAPLRATYLDEDQDLGTPIREAMTEIQEVVAGADLVTQSLDEWAFELFAADTDASSRDSLIARDRNSEGLNEFLEQPSWSAGVNATWSRRAGRRHRLMSGIEWLWIDADFNEQTDVVEGEFARERMIPGKQQLGGLFFQDLMELSPKWRLTAAGRMDYIRNCGGGSRITTGGAVVNEVEYDVFSSGPSSTWAGLPRLSNLLARHGVPRLSSADRGPSSTAIRRRAAGWSRPTPTSIPNILTGVEAGSVSPAAAGAGRSRCSTATRFAIARPFSTYRRRDRRAASSSPAASSSRMASAASGQTSERRP